MSADPRTFVKQILPDGTVIERQVRVEELDFFGRFGAKAYSTTEWTIAPDTSAEFVLDDAGEKFAVGDDVQITALGVRECFAYGVLLSIDTTYEPALLTLSVNEPSRERGTFRSWELQVIARTSQGYYVDREWSVGVLGVGAVAEYAVGDGPTMTYSAFVAR